MLTVDWEMNDDDSRLIILLWAGINENYGQRNNKYRLQYDYDLQGSHWMREIEKSEQK